MVSSANENIAGQAAAVAGSYNEYVDKSHPELEGQPWPACAKWALGGQCSNGHQFWRILLCGKEWCPDCGQDSSWIHNRRVARWLPKAQQLDGFGYWVVEWPVASRDGLRSKAALSEAGKRVKGAFVALGYDEGLRRWHWFGDENPEEYGWNPHLNIITRGKYIEKGNLERMKGYLRYVLGEPDLIVNYHYRKTPGEMMHSLQYITRATFKNKSWDPQIVGVVEGFHNAQTWGNWHGPQLWSLDEHRGVSELEQGRCPICGEPIRWDSKPVEVSWLRRLEEMGLLADQGAGYFYQGQGPPPEHVTDEPDRDGLAAVCRANVQEARDRRDQVWLDKRIHLTETKASFFETLAELGVEV